MIINVFQSSYRIGCSRKRESRRDSVEGRLQRGVVVRVGFDVGVCVRFVVDAEDVNKNWKKSKRFFSRLGKLMSLCGGAAFDQMTNTQTVL